MVGKQSFSIHAPVNNLSPFILYPFSVNPSLDIPSSSICSAPYSTKAPSAYIIWKNTHGHECSSEKILSTSMRILLVQRGQPSCEGLFSLLGHPEVNCRTKGGINQRLDGSKGCSRGKGSILPPRGGFV